ncbi:hypothetical protein [Variovorax sp. dw_954]|uniref:IS66 family insertion sequence element accessory protein TnpA n=1 Tax=Variovorax sp. dw_954 TaxID=2720078 RepID=UPI001BD343AA|nr:hypothetical protein [Variovorax sp. dw_954]
MELEKDEVVRPAKHRVDWRTGKTMVERGDAFWRDHERQRVESGMSVPQYCEAHELALSTYRHRVSGRRRGSNVAVTTAPATAKQPISFVALNTPAAPKAAAMVAQEAESLEISLGGMTLHLKGKAADRVLERVMARLG